MLYTFKSYVEVKSIKLKPFNYKNLGSLLANKSYLGKLFYEEGRLFSLKDIYNLKREIDFINKFSVSDKNFMHFIESFYELYEYIEFTTEFLDMSKNNDLILFTFIADNGNYKLKIYELAKISPLVFTESDFSSLLNELYKFEYYKTHSQIVLSQGFLSVDEIEEIKDEMKKILDEKLISQKSRKIIEFFVENKKKKGEEFFLMEKYLNVYH